jgi:uncharacterized oxidoreductase
MNLSGNKILITGGASGIGLGLTARFIQENNTVIICGRRESFLKEAADRYPSVITYNCDLTKKNDRESLFSWISREHSDLNVLINNAGIQQWMKMSDDNYIDMVHDEIVINIETPIHLTNMFSNLKSLNTVMNVTSGLAFAPMSRIAVYCASKAFLHSYTLSLRHLLKSKNIEVIEIIPPALNTDLGGKGLHDSHPPVSEFIDAIFLQLKSGKTVLTYGFSEAMTKAGPDELEKAFNRMNT